MNRIVIGLGSPDRGDDAAGLEVAARLRAVDAVVHLGDPMQLADLWRGYDEVVVVDAMRSGETPGTSVWFDVAATELPPGSFTSSHQVDLATAVAVARALGDLPPRVVVVGIEVASTGLGDGLSGPVAHAVEELAEVIDGA